MKDQENKNIPQGETPEQEKESKKLRAMADQLNTEEQKILGEGMLEDLDKVAKRDEKREQARSKITHMSEFNSGRNFIYEDQVSYQRARKQKLEDMRNNSPDASDEELEKQLTEFWGMPSELSDEELEDRYYMEGTKERKNWEESKKKGARVRKTF